MGNNYIYNCAPISSIVLAAEPRGYSGLELPWIPAYSHYSIVAYFPPIGVSPLLIPPIGLFPISGVSYLIFVLPLPGNDVGATYNLTLGTTPFPLAYPIQLAASGWEVS
jgi:hypothetical protein